MKRIARGLISNKRVSLNSKIRKDNNKICFTIFNSIPLITAFMDKKSTCRSKLRSNHILIYRNEYLRSTWGSIIYLLSLERENKKLVIRN